jgi:signal transduction histidine kinase
MDRFVHDLLELSKVTRATITLEVVDLRVIVGEALAILDAQIKERQALVKIEGDLGTVAADRMLLVRSLQNLVSNAIKFVPSDRTPQVKIIVTREGGHLRIAVQDNGIGIDPADVTRAFRAFERVAPAEYPGTGVGLAIVQKSAEHLGGRAGVDSTVGEGSTFWMSILVRAE